MENFKVGEYFKYAWSIREAERRHSIPENLLAKLLCHTSEGFNREVIDGTKHKSIGVLGIAKFSPDEGRYLAVDRTDSAASINAAGHYLKELYAVTHKWESALLAFRWGKDNYVKWEHGGRGAPVPDEAREFMAKILH